MYTFTSLAWRIIVSISILFFACAQPVSPTGGDKDTTPPALVSVSYPENAVNVKPKKITFFFNENIQLKNAEKSIVISPIISPAPQFSKSNKSITVTLNPDSLSPSTTYAISFNDAISDLNEGNVFPLYHYLFSTGPSLDTQFIKGKIIYLEKPKKDALKLWSFSDQNTPKYTAKMVNETFVIFGLNNEPKKIVVFNDENNNDLPDPQEDLGYTSAASPGSDTATVLIYPRKKITINTFNINGISYLHGIPHYMLPDIQDRFLCHRINDTLFADSQIITNVKKYLSPDRFIISELTETHNPYLAFHVAQNSTDTSSRSSHVFFNQVIKQLDTTRLSSDSIAHLKFRNNIVMIQSLSPVTLKLRPGALTFADGSINQDSLEIKSSYFDAILRLKNESSGLVVGTIKNKTAAIPFTIRAGETLELYVSQGTYDIFYFKDTNGNLLLDPPRPENDLTTTGEPWKILPNITSDRKFENEIILK